MILGQLLSRTSCN